MQELVGGIEDGSTLAALPDMLAGHRLAGSGSDRDAICDALLAHGANPLLVAAFRARRPARAGIRRLNCAPRDLTRRKNRAENSSLRVDVTFTPHR